MASYSRFLGCEVTVQYRVGDVLLPASGTFAADSGRSIFLEQHIEQRGKRNYFRWEIPYQFIHRIEQAKESTESPEAPGDLGHSPASPESSPPPAARAAHAASGTSSLTSSRRRKTA